MAETVHEIMVDASPETIFPLLVDADQHVRWMGTEARLDARPGGDYDVLVAGRYRASGKFVDVVPNERVTFTFGWDSNEMPLPPGSSTVEISLRPEGDKTRVRLVHRDLPDEAVGPHAHGWSHYVARLVVASTGGDNGPDLGPAGGDGTGAGSGGEDAPAR